MNVPYILSVALLVFGFGFVIFWHELGHFLAAKWVGIRVEQFAVGFGQALLAYRKGIGLRVGTTTPEYERRIRAHLETAPAGGELKVKEHNELPSAEVARAAAALNLGETEYRLNWIPLGGYVKMLGQDDLAPNSEADDPRAYNRKSIGARMLVVSAGVIMNVILAAVGFMVVFRMGFDVAPARVGSIAPNSPAQQAGLQVGDHIWTFGGTRQYDFTKIQLNVALAGGDRPVPMEVKRVVDGQEQLVRLDVTPRRAKGSANGFLDIGIAPPSELTGVVAKDQEFDEAQTKELAAPEQLALKAGDVITTINGQAVNPKDYVVLDRVVQASFGKPLTLGVTGPDGQRRDVSVRPEFVPPFDGPFNLLGMVPRAAVGSIAPVSPARGKLLPGDAIAGLSVGGDAVRHPTTERLMEALNKAGQDGRAVDFDVVRGGQAVAVKGLTPSVKLNSERRGLAIGLGVDGGHAVLADVTPDSPAARANIPAGAIVKSVNGKPVQSWYDVHEALAAAKAGEPVNVEYTTEGGEAKSAALALGGDDLAALGRVRYAHGLLLGSWKEPRKTDSLLTAAAWGVTETRDFILQFYVTLRRMIDGTVSPTNAMGPIGIFAAGSNVAYRGNDWLLWFLSMISANLAVVNFLPIPIVDGGLFTFLVLEKIKGRPLSARTQSVAQLVGLVLLLGVFLFVTYNDISRLTFMR